MSDRFRAAQVNAFAGANINFLPWLVVGRLIVVAVLFVNAGSAADPYRQLRLSNLGFAILSLGAILLAATPLSGGGR